MQCRTQTVRANQQVFTDTEWQLDSSLYQVGAHTQNAATLAGGCIKLLGGAGCDNSNFILTASPGSIGIIDPTTSTVVEGNNLVIKAQACACWQ
jgi:hypothetical protein